MSALPSMRVSGRMTKRSKCDDAERCYGLGDLQVRVRGNLSTLGYVDAYFRQFASASRAFDYLITLRTGNHLLENIPDANSEHEQEILHAHLELRYSKFHANGS